MLLTVNGPSPQIGFRLPADVYNWVETLAEPEQMSVAAYIKRAVERSHAKATLAVTQRG